MFKKKRDISNYNYVVTLCASYIITLLVYGCGSGDELLNHDIMTQKVFTISFLKEHNAFLENDINISFKNDSIVDMFIPKIKVDSLIASFDDNLFVVKVGGANLMSGQTANNYNNPVRFNVSLKNKANEANNRTYILYLKGWDGIPVVDIYIENMEEVFSKEEYLNAQIKIFNTPANGVVDSTCKIKGRGHGTWRGDKDGKAPYKIKFNKRTSVFSFPACKKWVLLSTTVDRSFLRTPIMFEIGKALDMEFIPNYQFIDLYINNTYRGLYLLTDQIEIDKNRITNVDPEGFFIERDNSYEEEPLYFRSSPEFDNYYTFKYPDPKEGKINKGDDSYTFIRDYMVNMENSLLSILDGDGNSYRKYVDVESFAKWYVASQLLSNYDPNFFFVLKNRNDKMKMVTLWDADWSLANGGMVDGEWLTPPEKVSPNSILYWYYFYYLTRDSFFNKVALDKWYSIKESLPQIKEKIGQLKQSIIYAQEENFKVWNVLGVYSKPRLTSFLTWEEEVNYALDFLEKRIVFLDKHFYDVVGN